MSWRFTLLRSGRVILGLLLAAVFQSAAFAEGGCPPGQYPIGGQGVQGCAPIPGAGDGSLKTPQPGGSGSKRGARSLFLLRARLECLPGGVVSLTQRQRL